MIFQVLHSKWFCYLLLLCQNFIILWAFLWLRAKESTCQCRGHRFDPWVRKIPWRRKWQHALVFLPRKSHGQRSLVGYSPWGHKESDTTEQLCTHGVFSRFNHIVACISTKHYVLRPQSKHLRQIQLALVHKRT